MSNNTRPEIDNHTTKLIVGLIAISLALLTNLFSTDTLPSISSSYWQPEHTPRNIFVGFLFAIGAFLLSYNGKPERPLQMRLSKFGAFAAFCVALFPCNCDCEKIEIVCGNEVFHPIVSMIHVGATVAMFVVIAVFCYFFFDAARSKGTVDSKIRSIIYLLCGIVIVMSIILLGLYKFDLIDVSYDSFTYLFENVALIAFGIAWLTASRKLPIISGSDRIPLFPM